MALIIAKGFLINTQNFQTFDQVITFLDEVGKKISLVAMGTRKIASKNGRNLIIGNFNEFEYFPARMDNKIGKLKKTISISPIKWEFHDYLSFNVLNQYIYLTSKTNKEDFAFYKTVLELIERNKYKDLAILTIILIFIIKNNGLPLSSISCYECKSSDVYAIELKQYHWLCKNCVQKMNNNYIFSSKIITVIKSMLMHKRLETKLEKNEIQIIIKILENVIYQETGIKFQCLNNLGTKKQQTNGS